MDGLVDESFCTVASLLVYLLCVKPRGELARLSLVGLVVNKKEKAFV